MYFIKTFPGNRYWCSWRNEFPSWVRRRYMIENVEIGLDVVEDLSSSVSLGLSVYVWKLGLVEIVVVVSSRQPEKNQSWEFSQFSVDCQKNDCFVFSSLPLLSPSQKKHKYTSWRILTQNRNKTVHFPQNFQLQVASRKTKDRRVRLWAVSWNVSRMR